MAEPGEGFSKILEKSLWRILRKLQPPAIAERRIALGWLDWSHARLRETLEDFRSLEAEAFLEKYGG